MWQAAITETSATFTGVNGHTYSFYSVATDNVGNVEATPNAAEATTHVDAIPPTSTVTALPAFNRGRLTVTWSGNDNTGGSGLASYNVYVSDNGGTYTLWQAASTQTSATFIGANGHTYSFYTVASDRVGNVEATPSTGEASTRVDITPPTSTVTTLPAFSPGSFTVSWSGRDNAGGSGLATYNIYVSDNGSARTLWQAATTRTSATFTGLNAHVYKFSSAATDTIGNVEARPTAAEATTHVDTAAPTSTVLKLPTVEQANLQFHGRARTQEARASRTTTFTFRTTVRLTLGG